jgi:hypothetical protein
MPTSSITETTPRALIKRPTAMGRKALIAELKAADAYTGHSKDSVAQLAAALTAARGGRSSSLPEACHPAPSGHDIAADAPKAPKERAFDEPAGPVAWSLVLWAKGERPLVEGIIAGAFAEQVPAVTPTVEDDGRLSVPNAEAGYLLLEAVTAAQDANANAYHGWLLDLLATQLRRAFPSLDAPNNRLGHRVASALNDLLADGAIADWRAFTPSGPTKLSFWVRLTDGTEERLVRARFAMAWITEFRAALPGAPVEAAG